MSTPVLITILASIISGLAGALISTIIFIRREERMFKVMTLKKFAANRYFMLGKEFTESLNEIFVVFNDCPEVMKELEKFHHIITTNQGTEPANDGLVRLHKAMCKATKIDYDHFNDSFFLKPFNVRNVNIQQKKN